MIMKGDESHICSHLGCDDTQTKNKVCLKEMGTNL